MGVGWVLLAKGVSLMDERVDLRGETRLEFGDFAPGDMGFGSSEEDLAESLFPLRA